MIQLLDSGIDVDIRGIGVCEEKSKEGEEKDERESGVIAY